MISRLEISQTNLLHNYKEFDKYLNGKSEIISVVKSNAYGHGLKEVVSVLNPYTSIFMVDDIQELESIRKFTSKAVLVSGYVASEDLERAIELKCILSLYDIPRLRLLNQIAKNKAHQVQIHIKVDALLGRQGVMLEDFEVFLAELLNCTNVSAIGIYSHFSDLEDTTNLRHSKNQITMFNKFLALAHKNGLTNLKTHMCATAGTLVFPTLNYDYVRLGIGLYGLWKSEKLRAAFASQIELKPVLSWKTIVAQVKHIPQGYPISYGCTFIAPSPMVVAVIPQGYSDGYPRNLSNKAEVLIHGARCQILGRIAMNMFVVDASHLTDVSAEDEVVLIGEQGTQVITASELAIASINYEIEARLNSLIPRILI